MGSIIHFPMIEPGVSNLITVEQAIAILDSAPVRAHPSRINIDESIGLFLAEELQIDRDSPPFDKALMDGYAVRASDVQNTPCELKIAGTVAAGGSANFSLQPGHALAIMTGAPLPPGADAVVPVESTELLDAGSRVKISEPTQIGRHIASRGFEATAGAVVLKAGMRIGPPQIAVAASIGAVILPIFSPPSVAVLGTGDELVPPDQIPNGSQIRSSNNAMLLALLSRLPCKSTDLGIVHDDPSAIEQKIKAGLAHDVLLITGGMSMGQRDFVPEILRRLGADLKIAKLRIKPGKPFIFAELPGGKFVFGLPGNPVSAFVCTIRLVSRLLFRMAGGSPAAATHVAPLAQPLEANGPREFYQPAVYSAGKLSPLNWKGSADIFTLSRANSLIIRPENHPAQPAGASVEFLEI